MKHRHRSRLLLAALLLAGAALPLRAGAAPLSCTVTSPRLNFGAYNAVTGVARTSSATLTVRCTGTGHAGHSVTVSLNAGLHSSGSFNPRLMQNTNASDTLAYDLYITPTYIPANIWGDGTAGTNTVTVRTNNAAPTSTARSRIYGQIPAGLDPSGVCPGTPCAYGDTVVITINF